MCPNGHKWKIVRRKMVGGKYLQTVKCITCGKEKEEPQTTPMFAWITSW